MTGCGYDDALDRCGGRVEYRCILVDQDGVERGSTDSCALHLGDWIVDLFEQTEDANGIIVYEWRETIPDGELEEDPV